MHRQWKRLQMDFEAEIISAYTVGEFINVEFAGAETLLAPALTFPTASIPHRLHSLLLF